MNTFASHRAGARGFALFTSMMFLIILTTLAVVVLKTSTNNERIAGGDLDRALAYQLAEATIRDAQQDVLNLLSTGGPCVAPPPACRPQTDTPNKDGGMSDISYFGTCRLGRCYLGPGSDPLAAPGDPGTLYDDGPRFVPPWSMPLRTPTDPDRPYATFGQFSGANWALIRDATGAAREPRYWIEIFRSGVSNSEKFFYRITVEAVGRSPNSTVRLQEIYEPL